MHLPTVAEASAIYLAEITPTKAPTTRRHDRFYARIVSGAVPGLSIAELAPAHVDALHQQLGRDEGKRTLANRVLSFWSQLCALAERRGWRPAGSRPTTSIRRFRESRRTQFLRADERRRFLEACWSCAQRGEVTAGAACLCLLLLLAGLRFGEAAELRWDEVDLRRGVIRLRRRDDGRESNKGDEDAARPITDQVVAIIGTMPRFCAWICPNPRTREPYTDVRKAMRRICEVAGVSPRTTRHALRHSFGSALAEANFTPKKISRWLGQRSQLSAERYVHLQATDLRRDSARVEAATRGGGAA